MKLFPHKESQMEDLLGCKLQCGCRLRHQPVIQINRLRRISFSLLFVRYQSHDKLHHNEQKWCPDQSHHNIKGGMCIGDLSGNNLYLRSLW